MLDEYLSLLTQMSPEVKAQATKAILEGTKRFKKFVPLPGPQTDAYLSDADVLLYGGQAGGGKLLDVNELLPTPTGWIRMGDISVGDTIFDETGSQARVTVVSPIREAKTYRLTFDDNSEVICCAEHLWLTFDAKQLADLLTKTDGWRARRREKRLSKIGGKKSEKFTAMISARNAAAAKGGPVPTGSVRTTQQIVDTLITASGRRNHAVQVAGAIDTPHAELPVDPYTLGAWLGDGTSKNGGFTGIDPFIWQQIEAAGYVVTHSISEEKHHYIRNLVPGLREIGVLNNKHVPARYLRADKEQRIALLQGLMDTDGHAALDGGCEFDNTNRQLIDAVYELVVSLGIKATINEGIAKLNGVEIGPKWRVKFVTSEPVFRLPRKRARLKSQIRRTTKFRYIVDAIEIDPVPMRCIAVDSPSHLYLATRSFIPTHNTGLLVGASQEFENSIIFRRETSQTDGLEKFGKEIFGVDGFNGSDLEWSHTDGSSLKLAGMKEADSWMKHAGRARQYMGFDEAGEFLVMQVASLLAWLRGRPGQRCRMILASNPPRTADGAWMLTWFAPWLDETFPDPAKVGELRWAFMDPDKMQPIWVDGPDPKVREDGDEPETPISFTFIPARLEDNPYADTPEYRAKLNSLPEPLRSQLKKGLFVLGGEDDPWQVMPTRWVQEAMQRWSPHSPKDVPMCSIGADVAQGGSDHTVLSPRFGHWFGPFIDVPGSQTPGGTDVAGLVIAKRRDNAKVIVDIGGGWGGDAYAHLKENQIDCVGYMGVKPSVARTKDKQLKFFNVRAQAYWQLREALNPDQPGGSEIALPNDKELLADLCAPRFDVEKLGIKITPKEQIVKRLGRSPDKGDAVVMAWFDGDRVEYYEGGFPVRGSRKGKKNVTVRLGRFDKRH